ncbi:tyramine oxidase subunit B [Brevibacterium samyangense]|uniref:Tyramine oxidase subunit B n=1 Tax=Brevibacterium samyangense TaxID=366888 RepID=A0ABP5EYB0_9MICO
MTAEAVAPSVPPAAPTTPATATPVIPEATAAVLPDLPTVDFLWLSEPDMIAAGVTDMKLVVDTMEKTLGLLAAGDYRMAGDNNDSHGAMVSFPADPTHPGMPKDAEDRRFMAMPAYLGGEFGTTGVKWYGSNVDNKGRGLPRSVHLFVLNDTETGAPIALMSANLLSAYRTGAVPGLGARYFARPDSKVVGVLGPGVMAKTTLASFVVECPELDTLKLKGRGQKSLENFIAWVKETYPQFTTIEVVDTVEDVVRGSDLVTYCTTSGEKNPDTYPLVKKEWVKPGAFLAMPSSCNVDDAMLGTTKVLDGWGLYEAWYHEVPKPSHHHVPILGSKFADLVFDGKMKREDLVEIGDVVNGDRPARQSDEEIVIMSVGGMPVEDVALATTVYRRAKDLGLGQSLRLWDAPALA